MSKNQLDIQKNKTIVENIIIGENAEYKVLKFLKKSVYLIERQFFEDLFVLKPYENEEYKMLKILNQNGDNSSPLIIRLYDISKDKKYIILEYIEGSTIFDLIILKQKISEEIILKISKCILQGLRYIHEKGVVHSDIHEGNIMFSNFNDNLKVKIIDFGSSRTFDASVSKFEKLKWEDIRETPDPRIDIYGLGQILLQLLQIKLQYPYLQNFIKEFGSTQRIKNLTLYEIIKKCLEEKSNANELLKLFG